MPYAAAGQSCTTPERPRNAVIKYTEESGAVEYFGLPGRNVVSRKQGSLQLRGTRKSSDR